MGAIRFIDRFLNTITMYRLVLYGLCTLSVIALVFGLWGLLPFTLWQMLATGVTVFVACFLTQKVLERLLKATTNYESVFITAGILFLIVPPSLAQQDLLVTFGIGVVAIVSKFFLAIRKKHLFNPAAFSLFIFGLFGFGNAIWWVGSAVLLPFVTIIGLLIVRKIRRFNLFLSFVIVASITVCLFNIQYQISFIDSLQQVFLSWPIIFFGTVMLTEPLTMPPRRLLQGIYGGIVGLFFGAQFHVGPVFASPELALLIGNLFSYIVSSKDKLFLHVSSVTKLTPTVYELVFPKPVSFSFLPGQYLEWTLKQDKIDRRGNRRYFTIASSPTESDLRLGIRYSTPSSTFKETLVHLPKGGEIIATQLRGDFVLPKNTTQKLVFIAGGIGVTPFRSMVKYLLDRQEKRDVSLFYSNADAKDMAYKEMFDQAVKQLGIKVFYVLTDKEKVPQGWQGIVGRLDEKIFSREVLDYKERVWYLSGPEAMVDGYKEVLSRLGVSSTNIRTDYFPGF
ncbi:MAG TPA: oxidoreductase [Patescibacteria group bacterium]|nr:oxidoreductase [Patescibacteria group bacterium]